MVRCCELGRGLRPLPLSWTRPLLLLLLLSGLGDLMASSAHAFGEYWDECGECDEYWCGECGVELPWRVLLVASVVNALFGASCVRNYECGEIHKFISLWCRKYSGCHDGKLLVVVVKILFIYLTIFVFN
ncbi:hypothetical protein E2C01_090444 [Portunus trituberculatus]|uniref:Uncharacterized protein n=1 Tax=Portunus trituberculatus TaxID=210409 RepID=A0A5B7JGL3_PORTR|nr:hypothetical protein [Portunus trituberculatus]